MTRIKIDLANGILDVEGEEAFVREIYSEYKERLLARPTASTPGKEANIAGTKRAKKTKADSKSKVGTKKKESYSIVKDLDLFNGGGEKGLEAFVKTKNPTTDKERNAVFVYYLKKIINIPAVTVDHVFTCYKHIGKPVPAVKQSLINTSFTKGWIDTSSMLDIKTTIPGENYVEHKLPETGNNSTK